MNTVKKDKDYHLMVEKILDDEDDISQFEPEGTSDKSWFKKEFVKMLNNNKCWRTHCWGNY